MSISPDIQSGPYTANGSQTAFPFTFTAVSASEVAVSVNGVAVVSGFTVAITASPGNGGTVTFTVAPTAGAVVLLSADPDYIQESLFDNQGAFNASTVNQINRRQTVRALVTEKKYDALLPLVAIADDIVTVAGIADDVTTLAGISADVSALAPIVSDITAVGDIAGAVTAVDANAANITTVAGISANVTTVAGIAANVTAVAGAVTNINAVATDLALGADASFILRAPQAATSAAASAAAAAAAIIPLYAASVKSAVGAGSLKALWDMDAGRVGYSATVTITIASPGVVTSTGHNLNNTDVVYLSTTGALPTGLTAGVGYYVVNKTTNTYQLSLTSGGAAINTTGSQSGVHTATLASTIMTSWSSLDDTPLTLSVYSSIFAGADPRPYYNARGIYMGAQAGLQTTSPIFSKTSGDFAFMMALDLNTVTSTVSLQASLPGSPADGDMVLVNADRNVVTGYGTDVKTVLDTQWTQADLVNGYHKWNSSASVWERSFYLFKATGPSGSRFEASINHLGQFIVFIYDGTNSVQLISKGNVLMGQSKLLVAFRRRGNTIYVIVNGKTLFGIGSTALPNITDLNQWYFNGSSRTANTVQPINNGLRHYVKGIVAADDLTVDCFRDLHDIVAKRHGTPAIVRPRAARGIVVFGQSWTDGSTAVSDLWRAGPNSWDGQVRANNATYAQEANSVTREAFPNVFAHRGRDNPWDIAPYAVQVDASGNLANVSSHDLDVSGENFVAGMAKQLNAHAQGAVTDWIVSGFGSGGATIAILSYQSVVPLVQQLKTVTLAGNDYYNKVLREIVYARDFAYSKGQTYTVDVFVWQQGQSDSTNASYLTALYALYDRFVTDIQAITGQSHKPILFSPQINYSGDGVVNSCNSGTGVIDQLFIDMEEGGRGTRPMYCIGPMYQITSFIHPYRAGHRWIGELTGRTITRVLFDGESYGSLHPYAYTYSVGGTTIDIDYRVRSGRALTLSQTNDNNIYQVATNQGFDFTDASAGGVTISSVTATSATRIRVTLSGAIGAGDTIRYVGSQRFGNVSDGAKVDGLYYDQDWTATFVTNEPPFGNGNLNDLRQWATASRKVL